MNVMGRRSWRINNPSKIPYSDLCLLHHGAWLRASLANPLVEKKFWGMNTRLAANVRGREKM